MDSFKWKEIFNIGVEEIDRQHRIFLDLLNDCHERLSEGERGARYRDMISGLRKYAATHFRYEERLMLSKKVPRIEQHETEHRYFESQVSELQSARAGARQGTCESLMSFLRDWFLKHILEKDREIVNYLM